ncbi:hypothetical protein C8R43DRAFT_1083793 [Mycena crocata]|nr:hypothetical protein C8R43DRAFT_1083793 [Mycena crocata]
MPAPPEFLSYVDASANEFISGLKAAVAIPSISGDPAFRPRVIEMANWLNKKLHDVGVTTKLVDMGSEVMEGETLPLPPKTVLFYGHFDVQPAALSDGMEESGSEGLDDLVETEKHGWFKDVDCVCISDSYWLNTRTPAITWGLRGIVYFSLTVSGPARDLHSGEFGRAVHEPMTDLIDVMSRLVAPDGSILVNCVDDFVPPPDAEERGTYEKLDYSLADLEATVGASIALSEDKATVLMGCMRFPSLSLHGIEGAFSGPGAKTVIPAKVMGKFSIRLVPPQTPENVISLVTAYVEREFAKLNTKSKMYVNCFWDSGLLTRNRHAYRKLDVVGTGEPWVGDKTHWNYTAAIRATEAVYGKTPELTREGDSIPVTPTFANALGANVVLLPMGRGDDGAHSTNEKLDKSDFIQGLLGSYLYEIAAVKEVGSSKGEVMARG